MLTTETLIAILAEQTAAGEAIGRPLTVFLCDPQGHELFLHRAAGARWFTAKVAAAKARTAVSFGMSTEEFAAFRDRAPEVITEAAKHLTFTPTGLGGGLVVRDGDTVVAGLGVSGATAEQDAEVAGRIAAILAR